MLGELLDTQEKLLTRNDARGGDCDVALRAWDFDQTHPQRCHGTRHEAALLELVDDDGLAAARHTAENSAVKPREQGVQRTGGFPFCVVFDRVEPFDRELDALTQSMAEAQGA